MKQGEEIKMQKTIKGTSTNTYLACPNEANHPKNIIDGRKIMAELCITDKRNKRFCLICGEKLVTKKSKTKYELEVCGNCGNHKYPNEIYCVSCGEKF
jgi:NADH pyrophosphatase NudC (nudix superfamily)